MPFATRMAGRSQLLVLALCASAVATSCNDTPITLEPQRDGVNGEVLEIYSGNDQDGVVGGKLTRPLYARVVDAAGAPLAGHTVTWSVTGGGGTLQYASRVTLADGTARNLWTLGATLGSQMVTAQVSGIGSVDFNANANAAPYLSELAATPTILYTGYEEVRVTVTWRAQDPAGVQTFDAMIPPNFAVSENTCEAGMQVEDGIAPALVSGTIYNGVWGCDIIIPMSASQYLRDIRVHATNDVAVEANAIVEDALQQNDAVAPVISAITFTPLRVYTVQGAAPVTINWKVVDPAGVDELVVVLNEVSGGGNHVCFAGIDPEDGTEPVLISGTNTNGVWRCTINLPQSTVPRDYNVDVSAKDGGDNQGYRRAGRVLLQNDRTAPVVSNIVFTPTRVYTTMGEGTVTFTFRAVDPGGVQGIQVRIPMLVEPPGPGVDPVCGVATASPATLIAGTIYDGTWQCVGTLAQNNLFAQRRVQVAAGDFSNNFAQKEANGLLTQNDNVGPSITKIVFNPAIVNSASGPQTVTVTWTVKDAAGVMDSNAVVGSYGCSGAPLPASPSRWRCSFVVPQGGDSYNGPVNIDARDLSSNNSFVSSPGNIQIN